MTPNSLRVLIIDGHPDVGRGLQALVDEMPGLHVIGLATRGERGLAQAAQGAPDVALVDADLPGLCSMAAISLLRSRLPGVLIVAMGIYPQRKWIALEAGAHEFVLKDAGYEALRDAIAGGSGNGVESVAVAPSASADGRPSPGRLMGNEERVLS